MRIAISAETNQGMDSKISHHFGRCPHFVLVDLLEEQINALEIIDNPFYELHQPGQVPGFINDQKAGVMISGGMGRKALEFFEQFGIEVKTGAEGTVNDVINNFLAENFRLVLHVLTANPMTMITIMLGQVTNTSE